MSDVPYFDDLLLVSYLLNYEQSEEIIGLTFKGLNVFFVYVLRRKFARINNIIAYGWFVV